MVQTEYAYKITDQKVIERVVSDQFADINHAVLRKGDALPAHFSNSNVYLMIVRGNLNIILNDSEEQTYKRGHIVNIPYNTHMEISNKSNRILEFFIIKSPSPKFFEG